MIKELQERLIKGFSRFGYALHASGSGEVNNEFRKSETARSEERRVGKECI